MVKPERQSDQGNDERDLGRPAKVESRRNFVPAQHAILALHNAGGLNEAALLNFAKSFKYEESIAALSAMSAVKIATPADLETARVNFTRLMRSTAAHVVGFWRARQSA